MSEESELKRQQRKTKEIEEDNSGQSRIRFPTILRKEKEEQKEEEDERYPDKPHESQS